MTGLKDTKATGCQSIYHEHIGQYWLEVKRYYAMNFNHFKMEPHKHSEFEIMYVASGNCKIFFWDNEYSREEWNIKEGEYVLIDCNILHEMEVIKGTQCRILNLEISLVPKDIVPKDIVPKDIVQKKNGYCLEQLIEQSKSLKDLFSHPFSIIKGYDEAGGLHTIISELHKQLQTSMDNMEEHIMKNLILSQLLIEIGRQRARKYYGEGGSKYIRMTMTYLTNHFDEDIKIMDISKAVGISAAYLQRLFKEHMKMTIVDKVNELRIEKAKLLLETSHMPIIDIAVSVGFNNRQHFTHTFIKITGCPPAIYRKHKGNYHVWEGF